MQGLYVIVDPEHCAERDPLWVAERVLAGGCIALQLRAKALPDRPALELARALKQRCAAAGVPFWINDRPHLAVLCDADGLHLGQDDLPLAEARRIVGAMPIGRSTHDLTQVEAALREGADVLGFGPVFGTLSKARPDPVVGIEGLEAALARCDKPLIAIGGIDLERAKQLRAAGTRLCAVISAVCAAADPRTATEQLVQALR